ncbi:Uncharacterised protein [Bordetella pertussis]|nr:Uncharacterised protein [Bordetella pertussis]
MVARRKCHHAGAALFGRQAGDGVVAAAELERPHALEVLALEKDLRAGHGVGGGRGQHGRAMGHASQRGGRLLDVGVSGQLGLHGGILDGRTAIAASYRYRRRPAGARPARVVYDAFRARPDPNLWPFSPTRSLPCPILPALSRRNRCRPTRSRSNAPCGPRRWKNTSASSARANSWRSSSRPRASAARRSTMSCCSARRAWARPPWRTSSRTKWACSCARRPAPCWSARATWRRC